MFSADDHIRLINEMPHGTARAEAIANAIAEADAEADHEWRLYFRHEYIEESIFHGDCYKAIIQFPEYLAIFDEHPELQDDHVHDMMCAYKWVLEDIAEYYQVSREEIERYNEDFKQRCRKFGYAMRVAHMKLSSFYRFVDIELAKKEFEQYRRLPRDPGSDCAACEASYDAEFHLLIGEEEEALKLARPLFEGKKRCANVPVDTYRAFAEYYLYKGDLEEAAYHGARCERLAGNNPAHLDDISVLLELYSATDPQHGWTLLKQSMQNFLDCRNPYQRMLYARGAYRMFGTIIGLTEDPGERYTQSVLLRPLPVPYEQDKGMSLEALRDYFYGIAKEQAEKLDQRNGTDHFMKMLTTELTHAADNTLSGTALRAPSRHGLTAKSPVTLAVTVPAEQEPSLELLEERLKAADLGEDVELIMTDVDGILTATFRRDGILLEVRVAYIQEYPPLQARPAYDLSDEAFEEMLSIRQKFLVMARLGDKPMQDYALLLRMICELFPEMLGVIDALSQHAYSASWVRFAGKYPDAVEPGNLFGLYLSGSDETDEVWMSTTGMSVLGLRDLEVLGVTRENYGIYADMLDNVASIVTERGLLHDAGEFVATAYPDGETPYDLTWAPVEEHLREGSIAAEVERDMPTAALLLQTDDGDVLPPESGLFTEDASYDTGNAAFYRRLRLAKATFGVLAEAAQRPFERAAVRMEFELDEETADKVGYGIELLWGDVLRYEDGKVIVALGETSEALPDLHEGDEIEVTADNTAAWFVQPEGWERPVGENKAFILEEAML